MRGLALVSEILSSKVATGDKMLRKTSPIASPAPLRDFLEIPYEELEVLNLQAKQQRITRVKVDKVREERMRYLRDEKRI